MFHVMGYRSCWALLYRLCHLEYMFDMYPLKRRPPNFQPSQGPVYLSIYIYGRNQQLHPHPPFPILIRDRGGGGVGGGGGGTFSIMINLAEIGHHIFRCGQHYRNQEMLVW